MKRGDKMKVCIVAEGCYPYMVGGVSGWINSMIQSFPNIEFIVLAIVANRSMRGKFKYELPDNLTEVYEVYLDCLLYTSRYFPCIAGYQYARIEWF